MLVCGSSNRNSIWVAGHPLNITSAKYPLNSMYRFFMFLNFAHLFSFSYRIYILISYRIEMMGGGEEEVRGERPGFTPILPHSLLYINSFIFFFWCVVTFIFLNYPEIYVLIAYKIYMYGNAYMEYAAIYNRSRSRSRYSLHPHQTYLYYFRKSLAYVFCFFFSFFSKRSIFNNCFSRKLPCSRK